MELQRLEPSCNFQPAGNEAMYLLTKLLHQSLSITADISSFDGISNLWCRHPQCTEVHRGDKHMGKNRWFRCRSQQTTIHMIGEVQIVGYLGSDTTPTQEPVRPVRQEEGQQQHVELRSIKLGL